jgi:hypothetical protein
MKSVFDGHSPTDMNGIVIPLNAAPQGIAKIVNPNASPNALAIQIQVLDGMVIVDLGQPARWFGMTPDEAGKLSADLEVAVRSARTLHVPKED